MVLWTIQHVAAWERLQLNGVLRADGRRAWFDFRESYRWMAEQMRLRLSPPGGGFPLWGGTGAREYEERGRTSVLPGT